VIRLMRVPSFLYTVIFNRTTLFPTHLGGFSVRLDVYFTFLTSTMDPDFLTDEFLAPSSCASLEVFYSRSHFYECMNTGLRMVSPSPVVVVARVALAQFVLK
jgi:hypothetical protein